MKIVYLTMFIALISCNDDSKPGAKSYEITLEKDTVNLTDFNGMKQGKWIIKNDTVYYKDNVIQKSH